MVITKDLGAVSAYAYAVEQGYQGTEEQFAELMARQATVAEEAAASADAAAESEQNAAASEQNAVTSATAASGSAATASTKASEAASSASGAASSAATASTKAAQAEQSATAAAQSASSAASAAQNAASSATAAESSASAAETAKQAAQDAQAAAETAQAAAEAAAQSVSESAAQIAKNTDNFASAFSTLTTYAIGDYCIYDGNLYRFINAHTGAWSASDVEATNVGGEIGELKNVLSEVESAFDYDKTNLILSNFTTGYIDNTGSAADDPALQYASVEITDEMVNTCLLVTGTAWWAIQPYVFVANDETTKSANVPNPGRTITQHTDLEFIPRKTGTLYVNRYSSGSVVQDASVATKSISELKSDYIPDDLSDSLMDAITYTVVPLTMIQGKLLSGNTGAITDNEDSSYRVSQEIEVDGDAFYLISTEMFWSNGLYVWYDEDHQYISGVNSQSGRTITKLYCKKVKSPKNAKYLVIGYLYQSNYPFPFLMAGKMQSITPSKRWSGKKWTCIGDSLTESYTVTGAHYFDLISAATGIEVVNKGVSGTGYARGTDNFMTRALTVPTDSDVVTFFGSGNDSGAGLELGTASDTGTETLGGCINTAIDNLYSIMPVVQLGIVTPTPWQGNMPSDNGWMARYSALIVEICNRRSIPCLDLFHCSNLNPNSAEVRQIAYARDNGGGVHPSEAGHAIIAPRFLTFLESLLMH